MKRSSLLLSVILVLAVVTIASACPACKDSIPSSDAQAPGSVPAGFNNSIYYMLITFFFALGIVVRTIVKGVNGSNVTRQPPRDDPPKRDDDLR
ncbi:MAG TPA: hypothetical protein VIL86_15285 [Tepidisphaeraceae bacterium]|jgi:hypothetical protein